MQADGTQRTESDRTEHNTRAAKYRRRRLRAYDDDRPLDTAPTHTVESKSRRTRAPTECRNDSTQRTAVQSARSSSTLMCSGRDHGADTMVCQRASGDSARSRTWPATAGTGGADEPGTGCEANASDEPSACRTAVLDVATTPIPVDEASHATTSSNQEAAVYEPRQRSPEVRERPIAAAKSGGGRRPE